MKRIIGILLVFICFGLCPSSAPVEGQTEVCKETQIEFTQLELTEENLKIVMDSIGVHHQDVVLKQALLETGHFQSKLCKQHGNLFGLRNSKGYYKYDHWSESVIAYRDKIQKRYKTNENYYSFLIRIKYSESYNYVQQLKQL